MSIAVQAESDRADYAAGEGAEREAEIDQLKQKRDQGIEEIEREEREERLLRERAERDREDAENPKPSEKVRAASRAASEAASVRGEDVPMRAATPQQNDGEEVEY